MRKEGAVHHRERGIRSTMIRVTVTAGQVGIIVFHPAVHRGDLFHLPGNDGVTCRATVCHRFLFPRRSMTGFAVSADLGMRRNATEHLSAFGIQWTRVI